jgi:hypothetical protein
MPRKHSEAGSRRSVASPLRRRRPSLGYRNAMPVGVADAPIRARSGLASRQDHPTSVCECTRACGEMPARSQRRRVYSKRSMRSKLFARTSASSPNLRTVSSAVVIPPSGLRTSCATVAALLLKSLSEPGVVERVFGPGIAVRTRHVCEQTPVGQAHQGTLLAHTLMKPHGPTQRFRRVGKVPGDDVRVDRRGDTIEIDGGDPPHADFLLATVDIKTCDAATATAKIRVPDTTGTRAVSGQGRRQVMVAATVPDLNRSDARHASQAYGVFGNSNMASHVLFDKLDISRWPTSNLRPNSMVILTCLAMVASTSTARFRTRLEAKLR